MIGSTIVHRGIPPRDPRRRQSTAVTAQKNVRPCELLGSREVNKHESKENMLHMWCRILV